MKEYNLITIYYDRTTNPKDKSMEIDEYVGTIILEILEKKGITENDEMLIDLTDTFLQNADFSQATDEYIINFIENELITCLRNEDDN